MRPSKKAMAVAAAAGLAVTAGLATPALADPTGTALVSLTGSGLIVSPSVTPGATSLRVCADAVTWVSGSSTSGALETSVVLAAQGTESYSSTPGGMPSSSQPLTGENEAVNLGSNNASACVPFSLHAIQSTVALTFEVAAAGSSLTGQYEAECEGSADRVLSGSWLVVNPCN